MDKTTVTVELTQAELQIILKSVMMLAEFRIESGIPARSSVNVVEKLHHFLVDTEQDCINHHK